MIHLPVGRCASTQHAAHRTGCATVQISSQRTSGPSKIVTSKPSGISRVCSVGGLPQA